MLSRPFVPSASSAFKPRSSPSGSPALKAVVPLNTSFPLPRERDFSLTPPSDILENISLMSDEDPTPLSFFRATSNSSFDSILSRDSPSISASSPSPFSSRFRSSSSSSWRSRSRSTPIEPPASYSSLLNEDTSRMFAYLENTRVYELYGPQRQIENIPFQESKTLFSHCFPNGAKIFLKIQELLLRVEEGFIDEDGICIQCVNKAKGYFKVFVSLGKVACAESLFSGHTLYPKFDNYCIEIKNLEIVDISQKVSIGPDSPILEADDHEVQLLCRGWEKIKITRDGIETELYIQNFLGTPLSYCEERLKGDREPEYDAFRDKILENFLIEGVRFILEKNYLVYDGLLLDNWLVLSDAKLTRIDFDFTPQQEVDNRFWSVENYKKPYNRILEHFCAHMELQFGEIWKSMGTASLTNEFEKIGQKLELFINMNRDTLGEDNIENIRHAFSIFYNEIIASPVQ